MANSFLAAVVQQAVSSNDVMENAACSEQYIRDAVSQGAQLVVLQELHSTQYFCQTEDVDHFDLAEPLDGPSFEFFASIARELNIVLVISCFERRAAGLCHNTAQVIDGDRGRVGFYRKMHIPDDPGFYEKFYFTPGDAEGRYKGFQPVDTRLGKLGVLVCWDQWYPEAARLMVMAGAECLIYPTAIGWDPQDEDDEQQRQKDAWITIQRSHAISNGVPILVANRTGYEASPDESASGIEFWGSSFVVGPQGEFLAKANTEEQGAIYGLVDLTRGEDVRRIWPFFRDRRVDAYANLTKRWIDESR